ncbi:MAG: protein kinase [Planctomycetota bacterium]
MTAPNGMSEPPSIGEDPIADLVARYILASEVEGKEAADSVLRSEPDHEPRARERIAALRAAGLLRDHEAAHPESIGSFRILERIGRGGMGEVYLAEQRGDLKRRVAIKVIRRGMDTREVLARFALERQTLAILDHPNIAKIYDAGETADGRPYLVMEYVAGVPITTYCDERGLDTDDRSRLFAVVCETVQHAHERGILHRDLKPGNILVSDRDGKPWPVVIDFGVAKSLQRSGSSGTIHTEIGRVLGTPEYMSPEQASNRLDLDTRSDVFSLGVILYELLTGELPVDSDRLRRAGQGEIEQILIRENPPTPSTRISTLGERGAIVASRRRTEPQALRRLLRGDLDWITMRALERDRNRRYPMAISIASDLRRHLALEPVSAGPPSSWYRLSRLLRRHRTFTVAASVVAVSLLGGLVTSLVFWHEAKAAHVNESQARVEAERSLETALRAADELLVEVGGQRLRRFPGMQEERRRMLESGLAFCRSVLADSANVVERAGMAGRVQARIAWFQHELDLDTAAEQTLDQVAPPAGSGRDSLEVRLAIANVRTAIHARHRRWSAAAATSGEALEHARALLALDPGDADAQDEVGRCLGRLAAAWIAIDPTDPRIRPLFAEANAATRRALERTGTPIARLPVLLRNWSIEAEWLVENLEPHPAERLLAELESQWNRLVEKSPQDFDLQEELAPALAMRARVLLVLGKEEAAETASKQVIEIREAVAKRYPDDEAARIAVADARLLLADNFVTRFRYREALVELDHCVRIGEAALARSAESGENRVRLAFSEAKRVMVYVDWRRLKSDLDLAPARVSLARAIELVGGVEDADITDPRQALNVGQVRFACGQMAEIDGDYQGALDQYHHAIALLEFDRRMKFDRASTFMTMHVVRRAAGRVSMRLERFADAESHLAAALEVEMGVRSIDPGYRGSTHRLRETFYLIALARGSLGRVDEALQALNDAIALEEGLQVVHRIASEHAVTIALRTQEPLARERLLQFAREQVELAGRVLLERHGSGPQGTADRMYRITEYQVYSQKRRVVGLMRLPTEHVGVCEDALASARRLLELGDDERSRRWTIESYDALIEALIAVGEHDRAGVARAERDSLRSR